MKTMRGKWVKAVLWAGLGILVSAAACRTPGGLLVVTTTTSGTGGSGGGTFAPAGHPPFPVLPPNDGSELHMPRLVVIVGPDESLADELFAFGDAMVQSAWLTAIGKDYGVTPTAGATSVHLTGAAVPATMDDTALRAYVEATIAANAGAAADGRTVYLFFYPPGTGYGDGCATAIGAHTTLETVAYQKGAPVDGLAWVQRCPAPGGMTELDALTIAASHEFAESVTDAYPPHGFALPAERWPQTGTSPPWSVSSWSYFQGGAIEAADLCEGTIIDEGGFAYQRIWSTPAAAAGGDPCVPGLAEPYYSASAPQDWITVPAGTVANVPITGWSTGPRADWFVTGFWAATHEAGFSASFAAGGATASGMNNGVTAMLSVTTPDAPGAFAVFQLVASESPPDPSTGVIPEPATGDRTHAWVFGVRTTCASCTEPPSCGDGTCETAKGETCATCPDDCGACGALCGASNLAVPCGASACPAHAVCQVGDVCACAEGFTSVTCDGEACSGASCVSPGWWCVPAACGAAGFTAPCGAGFCPADALCTSDERCACAPGSLATTCEGQPCPSGGCSYPDYTCTTCGAAIGRVACADGSLCPSFSACVAGPPTTCACLSGYYAVNCAGEACWTGAPCNGADWWCVPE
jgi:hypothetical protein